MLKTFVEQADEATRLEGQPWPECRSCLYWAATDAKEWMGECRRHAPDADAGWPTADRSRWCGEWAQFK